MHKDVFYHMLLLICFPLKTNNFDHLIAYSFLSFSSLKYFWILIMNFKVQDIIVDIIYALTLDFLSLVLYTGQKHWLFIDM